GIIGEKERVAVGQAGLLAKILLRARAFAAAIRWPRTRPQCVQHVSGSNGALNHCKAKTIFSERRSEAAIVLQQGVSVARKHDVPALESDRKSTRLNSSHE